MKQRGAMVIIEDGELIVIERVRAGRTYYLFPGGGVEPGETPAQAAIREAKEELGLHVRLGLLVAVVTHDDRQLYQERREQFYFLAEVLSGQFGTGDGPEMGSLATSDDGSYRPMRLPMQNLASFDIRPRRLAEALSSGQGLEEGEVLRFVD